MTDIAADAFRNQLAISGPGSYLFPSDENASGRQAPIEGTLPLVAPGEEPARVLRAHQAQLLKLYAFAFPLIFAEAIRHIQDEELRVVLVANLFEEHGCGDASKTHPALYRNRQNAESGGQWAIAGFILANEYAAPPLLTPIHATVADLGFSPDSLEYLSLRVDLDISLSATYSGLSR